MENHILLSEQLEHLKTHKEIISNPKEIEKFICDKPYEMTIQQVKMFFKGPNNDYISKPIEEWGAKYNQLDTDSYKMFRKIINSYVNNKTGYTLLTGIEQIRTDNK